MDWLEANGIKPGLQVQSKLVLVQCSPGLFAVFRTEPEGTKCGMCLIFLPAYSSDLNPIELVFLSIKVWLHEKCDFINRKMQNKGGMVYNSLWQAVYLVTLKKVRDWYEHCRY